MVTSINPLQYHSVTAYRELSPKYSLHDVAINCGKSLGDVTIFLKGKAGKQQFFITHQLIANY